MPSMTSISLIKSIASRNSISYIISIKSITNAIISNNTIIYNTPISSVAKKLMSGNDSY